MDGALAPRDRIFGRRRGHALRVHQKHLLDHALPRLTYSPGWGTEFNHLWLEVGFGAGEHAQAQAAAHPQTALIACEVYENGICSLLSRLTEAAAPLPTNLRLHPNDARPLLRALPDASLDGLFLLFPDPWPKTRHAQRRFVAPDTIELAAAKLKPAAFWRIASDDPTYQSWIATCLAAQPHFTVPPPATTRPPTWPPTRYEAKALLAGRQPFYWNLIRRGPPTAPPNSGDWPG